MNPRVARTKTPETAWKLIELLRLACPFNEWVVVMRSPDSGCELIPLGPFHKECERAAKDVVAKFAREQS